RFTRTTASDAGGRSAMARILLGVSGGISAYKAVELARRATTAGHSVRVLQTQASLEFVGRATFEGITGPPVLVGVFGSHPARGEWGIGRLAEPAELLAAVELAAGTGAPRPLDGLRVLVTAGGTREPLDSVRFIGNRSSGRMGFALAAEAARRGAHVTLVAANAALAAAPGVSVVPVATAAE